MLLSAWARRSPRERDCLQGAQSRGCSIKRTKEDALVEWRGKPEQMADWKSQNSVQEKESEH
jgi:hypothetical protein